MATDTAELARRVWDELAQVPDPEIPTVTVVDLGIVRSVEVGRAGIRVELLPTFVGCPAIEMMRSAVAERLAALADELAGDEPARQVEVELTFAEPWTSDRITGEGRRKLRASGFAPPPPVAAHADQRPLFETIRVGPPVAAPCPWCGSRDTRQENAFGPTLCRAIWACNACRQPFEQFKSI
jgi:ring-1,2-phenylacetyl-CoA epoxidase subunit PaaD